MVRSIFFCNGSCAALLPNQAHDSFQRRDELSFLLRTSICRREHNYFAPYRPSMPKFTLFALSRGRKSRSRFAPPLHVKSCVAWCGARRFTISMLTNCVNVRPKHAGMRLPASRLSPSNQLPSREISEKVHQQHRGIKWSKAVRHYRIYLDALFGMILAQDGQPYL